MQKTQTQHMQSAGKICSNHGALFVREHSEQPFFFTIGSSGKPCQGRAVSTWEQAPGQIRFLCNLNLVWTAKPINV